MPGKSARKKFQPLEHLRQRLIHSITRASPREIFVQNPLAATPDNFLPPASSFWPSSPALDSIDFFEIVEELLVVRVNAKHGLHDRRGEVVFALLEQVGRDAQSEVGYRLSPTWFFTGFLNGSYSFILMTIQRGKGNDVPHVRV